MHFSIIYASVLNVTFLVNIHTFYIYLTITAICKLFNLPILSAYDTRLISKYSFGYMHLTILSEDKYFASSIVYICSWTEKLAVL